MGGGKYSHTGIRSIAELQHASGRIQVEQAVHATDFWKAGISFRFRFFNFWSVLRFLARWIRLRHSLSSQFGLAAGTGTVTVTGDHFW